MIGVTFDSYGYSKKGTKVKVIDLKDILEYSKNLKVDKGKGKNGSIAAYNTGIANDYSSTGGAIFMDFDHVDRKDVEKVIDKDNFKKIAEFGGGNFILAIQPSSSYNDPKRTGCGLHIFIESNPIVSTKETQAEKEDEVTARYTELATMALAGVCEIIEQCCGVQLYDYIDDCCTKLSQKFWINKCDYRYNGRTAPFSENSFSKNTWKKLKEKYPKIFKKFDEQNKGNNIRCTNKNRKVACISGEYVLIQVKPQRTTHPKHDERYTMINVMVSQGYSDDEIYETQLAIRDNLGGEKERGFKGYIYGCCGTARREKAYNLSFTQYERGCRLLRECGYVSVKKNENSFIIPKGEHLSLYNDFILKTLEEHPRLLIQSDTGSGKTTFIKNYGIDNNCVIIVPFNSMLRLYCEEKVDEYGREIPPDILAVGTGQKWSYTEDKPIVMVWDQARKYDLSNRIVIIDESHELFLGGTYRPAAIDVMEKIRNLDRLICISATPAGEEKELGLYKLKFSWERNIIPVRWVNCKDNSGGFIRELIEEKEIDVKYFVYTDTYAKRLYREFCGSCLLHSEMKDTPDFKYVLEEEHLNNDVTFGTTIVKNGINIKNKEKFRVVVEIREGIDTANEIIQSVGRLRQAEIVEVVVVFSKYDGDPRTVDQKRIDSIGLSEIEEENNGNCILSSDEKYTDDRSFKVQKSIEEYLVPNSSKESIISSLIGVGYFSIKEEWNDKKYEKLRHKDKEESSNKLKEELKIHNGCLSELKYNELDDHSKKTVKKMNEIEFKVYVPWLEHIKVRRDDCLMDTIVDEIRWGLAACELDEVTYETCYGEVMLNKLREWRDKDGNKLSDYIIERAENRCKLMRDLRNKYIITDEIIINPEDKLIGEMLSIFIENYKKSIRLRSEGGRKGGKVGGKKGKSITIRDNKGKIFHFDTYDECRIKKLDNCSPNTFSKFLKGTSKYNKRYTIVND